MTVRPSMSPGVAVITIVHGRHDHLRRQVAGLRAAGLAPSAHVVVAMGDSLVPAVLTGAGWPADVVDVPGLAGGGLPLASARNAGAERALSSGAEVLVFLDVDCIPDPALIDFYLAAATDPAHQQSLLCGPVAYLPFIDSFEGVSLASVAAPHPARPAPVAGSVVAGEDYRLFWSLSFAVTAGTWRRIGGFCTEYSGYGGEDTDFAETARTAGVSLRWVGGAIAFHQYHPVSSPPVEHLADIIDNARLFHRRWGWWPMTGWLDAFAELGLARFGPDGWIACESLAVPR